MSFICWLPMSAHGEIIYDTSTIGASEETVRLDDNQRLGEMADVTNFNPTYIGASWSSAPTYDFSRSIMVYNLTSINPYAIITNVSLKFYVYDYITTTGMYVTATNITSAPNADSYALSHYGDVVGLALPSAKNAWVTIYIDPSAIHPGKTNYIGLIMLRDYDNEGSQTYNFVNAYGPSYTSTELRPSITIKYEIHPWAPQISSAPELYGNVSLPYSYSPVANESVSWNLDVAPEGATLNNGTLSWTPNATGFFNFALKCNNTVGGYSYQNWTVFVVPPWLGGETISDNMLGLIVVILLITALNVLGTRTGYLMLSVFAVLGMVFAIPLLWSNAPVNITLMMMMVLGNVALLVYGFTRS